MKEGKLRCPNCGSLELIENKKGFDGSTAILGAALTGSVAGLLAGFIDSDKVEFTCTKCGSKWKVRNN